MKKRLFEIAIVSIILCVGVWFTPKRFGNINTKQVHHIDVFDGNNGSDSQ